MIVEGRITDESIKSKLTVDEYGLFRDKNFCDTCCHQFSDICGTCETLKGVPTKYSEKEIDIDKTVEAIIEKIARKLSNDILFGMNRKETNADSIRTMTDEELARWIHQTRHNPLEDRNYREWLEWLKQEVDT